MALSRLPTELMFHIVGCLIPSNPPLAFPSSHAVTQNLLQLCLVSKTIHYDAVGYLFAHCLYIDSPDRLQLLHQTLTDCQLGRAFGSGVPLQSALAKDYRKLNLDGRLGRRPISFIKSLFLSPFSNGTIDSPEIAPLILSLCTTLGPRLTRLVIDIPLRSLYPEDDTNRVRPFLQAAFKELVALEEFVSAQDELYLDLTERDWDNPDVAVWSTWPHLKRLALYNVDVSSRGFLRDIQQCRNLTHLVLTRSDGLFDSIIPPSPPQPLQMSPHLQSVLIVNTDSSHIFNPAFSRQRWKDCFLGKVWTALSKRPGYGLSIVKISVPVPPGKEGDDIELCQEWVRDMAVQGTLWNSKGALLSVKAVAGLPEERPSFVIGWQVSDSPSLDLA